MIVPPGVRIVYPCFMPEWLETTRTSRMGMIAKAKCPTRRGMRHLVAPITGFITMTIEGAILKVSHTSLDLIAVPGGSFDVHVKIAQSAKLLQPVQLELQLPEELAGLLKAEPLVISPNQSQADLRITTVADPRLTGLQTFKIRGTSLQDGRWPAISETDVTVEFCEMPQKP